MLKLYKKAILPKHFKANGIWCGIKKSRKLDLALFYSDISAKASCLFTTNKIQAAPIKVCKQHLKSNKGVRAIVVNSGNANCFTGEQGERDAESTTKALAFALGIKKESVLVASTGIIGKRLQVGLINKVIPKLITGLSAKGIDKAKFSIMTTDIFPKQVTVKFNIGGKIVTVCGIAKGAGMIAPNMATMLVFIFTDANIAQQALNKSLNICVSGSFNCITVDGCMSTNDTVMLLANGASGNPVISAKKGFNAFVKALGIVCDELTKMIVRDAEGASKFIQIKVRGARSKEDALTAALFIANSNLFKTAMYGENPNFGRIVAGVGASGIAVREKDMKIKLSPLNKKDISVDVLIGKGKFSSIIYTSDLTPEYIRINAAYN